MPYTETPHDLGSEKIELSPNDVREAARLLRVIAGAISDKTGKRGEAKAPTHHDLAVRARTLLDGRRLRGKHFNRAMFGEPGWDILLVLYVSEGRQSIGQLAKWIETPLSTAVRWIDYLVKERLVEREPHPHDKRVMFIKLLEKGREQLEDYLSEMPWEG